MTRRRTTFKIINTLVTPGHPCAASTIVTPTELLSTARQDRLVEQCIEYQLNHEATTVIPPYLHLETADSGWIDVQAGLWLRTRRFLDLNGLRLPTLAVLAIGWRLLHHTSGVRALTPALNALTELTPTEVGLAASKVHAGMHPDDRLTELILMIQLLRRQHRVLAWQQGLLGEACVVAGADGYETGIGQRERCDLGQAMTNRRKPRAAETFGPRPVYVPALKRAVPKDTLRKLRQHRDVWFRVLCNDHDCCAVGTQILDDARSHAIFSRARDLTALTEVHRTNWQWNRLATETGAGLVLAQRINLLADRAGLYRVDTGALSAIHAVSDVRRQQRRARHVA